MLWTVAVLVVTGPLLLTLFLTLWRTPFPISEAVALFEDIANQPATRFLTPDTSYYRPLFHLTVSAIWHTAGPIETKLALVKLLQIVPAALLVLGVLLTIRPRTFLDAAAAAVAVFVVVGSGAFRDNIEIPLSYTTVGMPMALAIWILLNRETRRWHAPAILALALVAIGFKEQGLVVVPLVLLAWWTRAPGAGRGVAFSLAALAIAYVAWRLSWHGRWPLFEQAVGFGFREIEPAEAVTRFGDFPYWIYAYSGASTIANVLFSEPTRGVFRFTRDILAGATDVWQILSLTSSLLMTGLIAWWGVGAVRSVRSNGWTPDARLFLALIVALLACGALSFNYSRDRLGGMALVFYGLAAYTALGAAARRLADAPRLRFAIGSAAMVLLAFSWSTRALGTIESARVTALRNQIEWLTARPARSLEFAERPTYLSIMASMAAQGTEPTGPFPTRYPSWLVRTLGVQ